jgi:hypothetical protein
LNKKTLKRHGKGLLMKKLFKYKNNLRKIDKHYSMLKKRRMKIILEYL